MYRESVVVAERLSRDKSSRPSNRAEEPISGCKARLPLKRRCSRRLFYQKWPPFAQNERKRRWRPFRRARSRSSRTGEEFSPPPSCDTHLLTTLTLIPIGCDPAVPARSDWPVQWNRQQVGPLTLLPPFSLWTGPFPGGAIPKGFQETFRPACQDLPLVQTGNARLPIWIKWLNFMCFCWNNLNVHILIYCRVRRRARNLYS